LGGVLGTQVPAPDPRAKIVPLEGRVTVCAGLPLSDARMVY